MLFSTNFAQIKASLLQGKKIFSLQSRITAKVEIIHIVGVTFDPKTQNHTKNG